MPLPKKHLILVPSVILVALIIVSSLAWVALKPVTALNGFNRVISPIVPQQISGLKTEEGLITDVCELVNRKIFFQTKDADKVFVTTDSLKRGFMRDLLIPNNKWTKPSFSLFIDSYSVAVLPRTYPILIRCGMDAYESSTTKIPLDASIRAAQISPSSFAFKGFNKSSRGKAVFFKLNTANDSLLVDTVHTYSMNDGGISSDGYLTFDKKTKTLLYVNIYSNLVVARDTSLNIKYIGTTIDTISNLSIQTGQLNNGTYTNLGPARIINDYASADDGKLYVLSKIKADNDSKEQFGKNSAIEVYDAETGRYLYSFFIPDMNGEKIKRFKIFNHKLIAIYKTHIAIFNIA